MSKIAVYASNLGFAADIAKRIAPKLEIDEVVDVQDIEMSKLNDYDKILLVVSTHAEGEIQRDFNAKIDDFRALDLSGKTVALVGLGDGIGHGETFNNAQGQLYDIAKAAGATLIGSSDPEEYRYEETESIRDGKFPGLVLDVENEDHLTMRRINRWLEEVQSAF